MRFLALFALATAPAAHTHEIERLRAKVEPLVQASLNDPAPGVAITVIHGGELVWFGGFGVKDRKEGGEVTLDTVFAVASISKTVAAWGFLRLVEEQRIGLDDPVLEHLSGWRPRKRKYEPSGITLRRLLTHTTGLNVHGVNSVRVGRKLPSLVDAIHGRPSGFRRVDLVDPPGTRYRYSGGGTSIAQLLFEELRSEDFVTVMEREVLKPLGLELSGYQWNPERITAAASPYLPSGRKTPYTNYPQAASAAFVASSREFARFAIACLPDHRPPEAEGVLSRKALLAMLARSKLDPNLGMGVFHKRIRGLDTVGHTGGDYGWTSVLRMVPSRGDALIVLQNSFEAEPLSRRIEALWADWILGRI